AKQAKIALQEAEKAGVYLSEAMWTRFNPVVRQVVEWVKNGEIGEIKSIKANFCLPLKLTKNFVSKRVYKAEYAGGALLDLGVYPIAYCHMLLGKPTSIETKTRIFDGVDYDDQITLTYKNAICKLNCSFDKLMTYKGEIVGSKGKIVSPMFYKPNSATLINANGRKTVRCKKGYIFEFDGVASDIRLGKTENEFISHQDTIDVMQIMDKVRKLGRVKYPEKIEKV
ncbi:MAG: Gfo/Idh/MocA family oxidoreductase, partial [Clostridia bacterium]